MDFVEVDKTVPQERISVRSGEKSQGPSLLRIVEQMIDMSEISKLGCEVWQRTVTQFLDDTRHEPVSRISVCTRELKRIVSLFETVQERMYSKMLELGEGGRGGVKRRPEITVLSDVVEGLLREFASF